MKAKFWAPFILILLLGVQARADGTLTWTSCYPKPGSCAGSIEVKGTYTLDSGWSIVNGTGMLTAWQDGMVATYNSVYFDGMGGWSQTANLGLPSGTYNVIVEVSVTNGSTVTLATAPGTVTVN